MRQLWFDRNWNEFKVNTTMARMTQPLAVARRHLAQMVAWADALSATLAAESAVDFVRVDFLLGEDGPKFIEFSTYPGSCASERSYFTEAPALMRHVGELWHLPSYASDSD
jgi:hypothetical protein|tara:strand:- start:575 stop:907 length:333 start_codon:yes stop_codon:yes gene_type:complete